MLESLTTLISGSPWTYAIVLGFAAGDAILPFFPSETAAIAAGVLAGAGDLNILFVVAAAATGAFVGDNGSYGVGRTAGATITRPLFRGEKGLARRRWAERTLDQRGGYLLVAARFIPGGRTATTLTAGVTRMAWARFLRFVAVAAVLWASFAAGLGYLGGRAFEDQPVLGLVAAITVAATITLGVELVRRLPRPARPCAAC
jgi:membrane-associated protein